MFCSKNVPTTILSNRYNTIYNTTFQPPFLTQFANTSEKCWDWFMYYKILISTGVVLYPLLSIVDWGIGYCKTSRKPHSFVNEWTKNCVLVEIGVFCSKISTIFREKNLSPDLLSTFGIRWKTRLSTLVFLGRSILL